MNATKNRRPKPVSFKFSSVAKIRPRNCCLPPYGTRYNQSPSNRLAKRLPLLGSKRLEKLGRQYGFVIIWRLCAADRVSRISRISSAFKA